MDVCIWCKKESNTNSIEHIIPEALGCPDGFHLKDGAVCQRCNNGLAHLDQAVIDELDILAFMSGVPRKKKKSSLVNNRGNLLGRFINSNKTLFINMDKTPQTIEGHQIAGYGKSLRNINASFDVNGNQGKVSFTVKFGDNPKFVRGILKIAFSSLAYFLGTKVAILPKYDCIRKFVVKNEGERKIFLIPCSETGYRNQAWPPYVDSEGEYAVALRLGIIEFAVDLTQGMTSFPVLMEKLKEFYGNEGWTFLPL
jgi:hypothetical protein